MEMEESLEGMDIPGMPGESDDAGSGMDIPAMEEPSEPAGENQGLLVTRLRPGLRAAKLRGRVLKCYGGRRSSKKDRTPYCRESRVQPAQARKDRKCAKPWKPRPLQTKREAKAKVLKARAKKAKASLAPTSGRIASTRVERAASLTGNGGTKRWPEAPERTKRRRTFSDCRGRRQRRSSHRCRSREANARASRASSSRPQASRRPKEEESSSYYSEEAPSQATPGDKEARRLLAAVKTKPREARSKESRRTALLVAKVGRKRRNQPGLVMLLRWLCKSRPKTVILERQRRRQRQRQRLQRHMQRQQQASPFLVL